MKRGDTVYCISRNCGDCDYKEGLLGCAIGCTGFEKPCYHVSEKLYNPDEDTLDEGVFVNRVDAKRELNRIILASLKKEAY